MRRLLFILLLASIPASATIAPGAGCVNNGAGVVTLSCTMSPTAGSAVVIHIVTAGGTLTSLAVKDNNNNSLNAGTAITSGSTRIAPFYGTAVSGATSYTATWTGTSGASVTGEYYTGSVAFNAGLPGNTAGSTGTTATISVTTEDANDWIVCDISSNLQTLTVTVGNSRQVPAGGAKQVLLDNTAVSPGTVTCTATLSSANWAATAIELRTATSSGKCASCDISWMGEWGWGEEWAVGE